MNTRHSIAQHAQCPAGGREHAALLERIIEASPDAILLVDAAGRIVQANAQVEALFGYRPAELLGQRIELLVPERYRRLHARQRAEYNQCPRMRPLNAGLELYRRCKDGREFPVEIALSPVASAAGPLTLAVVRDITARKQLEAEVQAISENERRRFGQELHDGLSQQLAGIGYLSEALHQRLSERLPAEAAQAARIKQLLDDAIVQTKALARGLFPVKLESQGLMDALAELAGSVSGIYRATQCRFACPKPVLIDDINVATHLYRIAQEAIHNALRHGHATRVTLRLSRARAGVALTVRDNGAGFPAGRPAGSGLGLVTMERRARSIGAELQIQPAPRGGTLLTCFWRPAPRKT